MEIIYFIFSVKDQIGNIDFDVTPSLYNSIKIVASKSDGELITYDGLASGLSAWCKENRFEYKRETVKRMIAF